MKQCFDDMDQALADENDSIPLDCLGSRLEDHFKIVKVLLRRKYTFSNLSRYQNYITQIVVVPNLKSKLQREVR